MPWCSRASRLSTLFVLIASIVCVVVVAVLARHEPTGARIATLFGTVAPVAATAMACVAGATGLIFLQGFGLPLVCAATWPSDIKLACLAAVPFISAVTLIDLMVGFAPDINIPMPEAAL